MTGHTQSSALSPQSLPSEGDWIFVYTHQTVGKVIERSDLWGSLSFRVWLPSTDSIIRISQSQLSPAQSSVLSPHHLSYIAAAAREGLTETLRRYAEVAAMATGRRDADAGDCVAWLREFLTRLSVPSLRDFGFGPQLIPTAVAMARAATSMKANPIDLTDAELEQVLVKAMGDKPGGGQ